MTPYKNLGGNSGVLSYEVSDASIQVVFKSGRFRNYLYDGNRPGGVIVGQMKKLAEQGRGLNSYIVTTVKSRFSRKW